MEDVRKKKEVLRNNTTNIVANFSQKEIEILSDAIKNRLFSFANFLESAIILLYSGYKNGILFKNVIKQTLEIEKTVVVPFFTGEDKSFNLLKIEDFDKDLKKGSDGILRPNQTRCKEIPIDCLDIAIIPGIAFDERGGRLGTGNGNYDKLIPRLPITTRKVALAFERQIFPNIPMGSHDKHVDIIISEERVIYKI